MGYGFAASRLAAVAIAVLLSGCYRSYGLLDPPSIDAAVLRDADLIAELGPVVDGGAIRDAGIERDARPAFDASDLRDAGPPSVGSGTSFAIEAELTYPPFTTARRPEVLTATLWLAERSDGTLDAVLGTQGDAWRANLVRDADGTWPVQWRWVPRTPLEHCSLVVRATLDAGLTLYDDDGDGLVDRVEGRGEGRLQHRVTDFTEDFLDYTAVVRGHVEHEPPTLRWVSYVAGRLPLRRTQLPMLVSSEPMLTSAPGTAWVEATDGTLMDLYAVTDSDPPALVTHWYPMPPATGLLPFATELTPRFDGDLHDLTGLPLVPPPTLRTLPMPAPVVREGFEPGSTAYLEDHATTVSGIGSIGAISGTRSALVESRYPGAGGARLVTRIVVPSGATQLRFRARYLAAGIVPPPGPWGRASIVVFVHPLEGEASRLDVGPEALEHHATGDTIWTNASEIVDIAASLPATARDEVVVEIGENWGCGGMIPWLPKVSLLVDDIRAE